MASAWLRRAAYCLRDEVLIPAGVELAPLHTLDFAIAAPWAKNEDGSFYLGFSRGNTIFVMPVFDAQAMLGTLLHELLHFAFPTNTHDGDYATAALKCGLTEPLESSGSSPELLEKIRKILNRIGACPRHFDDLADGDTVIMPEWFALAH